MKKISFEEAIKTIKDGKKIIDSDGDEIWKDEDGFIWRKSLHNKRTFFNAGMDDCERYYLPEEPKPFEITETGLYKTKNGKRIFLYHKGSDVNFFDGVIEGEVIEGIWGADGKESDGNEHYDIVGEWDDGQH